MESMSLLPYSDAYWVINGKFMAGSYPATYGEENSRKRIQALLKSGVRTFIDLTQPGDSSSPYSSMLMQEAGEYGIEAIWKNYAIPDLGIPSKNQMKDVLDEIDQAIYTERIPYVHCMAGIGRTGTVVGCYLVRHGYPAGNVLIQIADLRKDVPSWWCNSPEVPEQVKFILGWKEGM